MSASPSITPGLPGGEPDAADAAVREQALAWQVLLWSGEVTAEEQRGFEHWLARHPRHRSAWQRIERSSRRLQDLTGSLGPATPAGLAGEVLKSSAEAKRRARRRQLLGGLLLGAGAGACGWATQRSEVWTLARADLGTARGERLDTELPDGSRLRLNTASAVDLRFDASARRIALRLGEIEVRAAGNDPRPFVVETHSGQVTTSAAHFVLRLFDDGPAPATQIQLFEGQAALRCQSGATEALQAVRQTRFDARQVLPPRAVDEHADAWTRGLLIAEARRLADFLAELGRYRPGVLRCDPSAAELRVSGVFPLRDTDAILATLATALPVRLRRLRA